MKRIIRKPALMTISPPLKKFSGHRSYEQIREACKAQGVELDSRRYKICGDDNVTLRGGGFTVVYNVVNGNFFGSTPAGDRFGNGDSRDGCAWFDALLGFFYYEAPSHG